MNKIKNSRTSLIVLGLVLIAGLIVTGSVLAGNSSEKSEADVYWSWDFMAGNTANPTGTSELTRTDSGISASYKAEGLTPGNAMTLWFIVFNNPEDCLGGPYNCSPLDLGPDGDAKGDFFLASGHVIGDSGKGNFGGHLNVGDVSGSEYAEMNCPDTLECAPGLVDSRESLVVLAIHDHGPQQSGQVLKEQISSFLGGCELPFNGNEFGFPTMAEELPDDYGECATIQFSPHAPAAE